MERGVGTSSGTFPKLIPAPKPVHEAKNSRVKQKTKSFWLTPEHMREVRHLHKLIAMIAAIATIGVTFLPGAVALADPPTSITDTLSTYVAGASATHDISFDLPSGGLSAGNYVALHFPDFTITGGASGLACTTGGFNIQSNDGHTFALTADTGGCDGTVTITGLPGVNPGTAGTYTVTISGDEPGFTTTGFNLEITSTSPTGITDNLNNPLPGFTATHSIGLTMPTGGLAVGNTMTLAFPDFTIDTSSVTASCGVGGFSTIGGDSHNLTLTADTGGCDGAVTISGLSGVNPGTVGTYTATISSDQFGFVSADFNIDIAIFPAALNPAIHLTDYRPDQVATVSLSFDLIGGGISAGHYLGFAADWAQGDYAGSVLPSPSDVVCEHGSFTDVYYIVPGYYRLMGLAAGPDGCSGHVTINNWVLKNSATLGVWGTDFQSDEPHFVNVNAWWLVPLTPGIYVNATSQRPNSTSTYTIAVDDVGFIGDTMDIVIPPEFTIVSDLSEIPISCAVGQDDAAYESGSSGNTIRLAYHPAAMCAGKMTLQVSLTNPSVAGAYNFTAQGFGPNPFDLVTSSDVFITGTDHPMGISDTLDRIAVSVPAVHSLQMTLPYGYLTDGQTMNVIYTDFGDLAEVGTGTLQATCAGATSVAVAIDGTDPKMLDITPTGDCTGGTLSVTGFKADNPGSSGSHIITINSPSGQRDALNIPIVLDDQVNVTAAVDPSITFDVGAEDAAILCSGSFTGDGGTVALGVIPINAVVSSDVNLVKHICTRLSTNATGGATVTVKSTNAGLMSGSNHLDLILSNGGTMAAGTANYGLCTDNIVSTDGATRSTPPSSDPVTNTLYFPDTCVSGTAAGDIGAVTTSAQPIWHVAHSTSAAYQSIEVKAAISPTTVAHTDYADTLTFVATGTF